MFGVKGMGIREGAGKQAVSLWLVVGLGAAAFRLHVSQTVEPASDANFTPRDRKLLANPPYAQAHDP